MQIVKVYDSLFVVYGPRAEDPPRVDYEVGVLVFCANTNPDNYPHTIKPDYQSELSNSDTRIFKMNGGHLPTSEVLVPVWEEISEAEELGHSTLLLSYTARQPFLLCCLFLLWKFKWALIKTMEFLNSRLEGIDLTQSQFQYLQSAESYLIRLGCSLSTSWDLQPLNSSELLLTNTFINATRKVVSKNVRKISKPTNVRKTVRFIESSAEGCGQILRMTRRNSTFNTLQTDTQRIIKPPITLSVKNIISGANLTSKTVSKELKGRISIRKEIPDDQTENKSPTELERASSSNRKKQLIRRIMVSNFQLDEKRDAKYNPHKVSVQFQRVA